MPEKIYSWDGIRDDLKRIHAHNPDFLPNTVLVGGAACWYYRLALTRAADADFQVPNYTPSEEDVWLSDPALRRRLHTSSRGLGPEHRAIAHWIQHHVPSLSRRDLV